MTIPLIMWNYGILNFNQSKSIIGTCSQSKFKTEMNYVEYHQSPIPFGPVVSENLQTMDDYKENVMTRSNIPSSKVRYILDITVLKLASIKKILSFKY